MRDRGTEAGTMSLANAKDILAHIVEQRLRWGKQYDAGDIGLLKLVDALVQLAYAEEGEAGALRKSLAEANRQKGACLAREIKLKKKIQELEEDLEGIKEINKVLREKE